MVSTSTTSFSVSSAIWRISKYCAFSTALSNTPKSKWFSSSRIFSRTALIVGFLEITPQNSGIDLAISSVPISFAIAIICSLSWVMSGRNTNASAASSIKRKFVKVWLETCPSASPVTIAWISKRCATLLAARTIIRFNTTPIWPLSTFSKISPTTPSKGMAIKRTLWDEL